MFRQSEESQSWQFITKMNLFILQLDIHNFEFVIKK